MKKIASALAGLAMVVALAGPASAAPTPTTPKAKSHKCSHRKGAPNKCAVKRTNHAAKKSVKKSMTPTTKKH